MHEPAPPAGVSGPELLVCTHATPLNDQVSWARPPEMAPPWISMRRPRLSKLTRKSERAVGEAVGVSCTQASPSQAQVSLRGDEPTAPPKRMIREEERSKPSPMPRRAPGPSAADAMRVHV